MIFKPNKDLVYDIKNETSGDKKYLSKHKGIYKFYVSKDLFDVLVSKTNLKSLSNFNSNLFETITFVKKNNKETKIYYCVYVGKTNASYGFLSRIVNSHIYGSSTLKKSFKKILNLNKRGQATKIFREECIFILDKVFEISDNVDLKKLELNEINNGYTHILNLDDNGFYLKDSKHIDILLEIQKSRNNLKKVKSSAKSSKNKAKSPKNSVKSKTSTSSKPKTTKP